MALSKVDDLSDVNSVTRKFKVILEKKGLEGLKNELKETLDCWKNSKIQIAVTGCAGAGKSTFINALLGLDDDTDDAAPTGITETTMECKQYSSKKHPSVIFWDLPGVGTQKFPRDGYVAKVKLETYDFFIIIARNNFTENDAWLANQIHKLGKQYFLVRSHVDQDIRNHKKAHPKSSDPEKQLSIIREDCGKLLRTDTIQITAESKSLEMIRVYLIDSFEMSQYDFNTLIGDLILVTGGVGDVKSCVLVAALSTATQEIIDEKFRKLLHRILYVSYQAGLNCNIVTADRVMKDVFAQESKYYREVFDIDDETLRADKELFSLTEQSVEKMTGLLKLINKRLNQSYVSRFQECLKQYKEKFNSDLCDGRIGPQNYVKIIFDFLSLYMVCMYQLATCLFQNVPIQIVDKLTH